MAKTGSKHTDKSDTELIRMALEAAAEQQAAFSLLYARYHASVSAYIAKYVSEPDEIEDICMETFAKAFQQLATYRDENRFSTWIFRIARNTAFDHMSREKVRGKNIEKKPIDYSDLEGIDMPSESDSPEEEIISTQDHENFLSCLEGLPDLYRDVAKMCFIDNLGYKEIAQKSGLPMGTVKTRISRAKNIIIRKMTDIEN